VSTSATNASAYTGTVLVQNPEKYLPKQEEGSNKDHQQ
jgi:hypothetical protein